MLRPMAIRSGRGLWKRGGASLALLLQLFLVGFVPAREVLHDHHHSTDVEWHSGDAHQHHGDGGPECPLESGQLSFGLVVAKVPPVADSPAVDWVETRAAEQPVPQLIRTSASARAPPLR